MKRVNTKSVKVGNIYIGGSNRITVQSMTNTDTRNIEDTVNQILKLEEEGCDIVRCAVPDEEAADAIKTIVNRIHIPLVADIHFDYRLALKSIENGVSALRINPGNIGNVDKVKAVAKAAREKNIPIRIGVNSGSLEKNLLNKYKKVCADALVESALNHVNILENINFDDIVISIKSSNVMMMIDSYRKISEKIAYPLHVGVTEAGTVWRGTIKSSVGIGTLLCEGIGDTIRVSLTGDPAEEIRVGKEILRAAGYLSKGIQFISCPTCGRTQIDLIKIAQEVEERLRNCDKNIKVAVMGCVVNGPGEAREADIGIAGGKGEGLIFKKGKVIKKVREDLLVEELIKEINKLD
ncbi:4-hydroxy-3-methylbut-2-en-1-yl diphosphate synthase [Clostridium pasteurianum DSM 525 = ATCC 6013]|uniref:4-hydroxy-3-methylbut-2-en-1-yl diphosphate synthase (flavodoxin) n=1 Tax=Clostridium pasteurianum DSM 525 = ATCC 6013 TaxID=1262449 RepID=A0A0H3J4Z9_CLOPA|nr:flavodoxin-dependent (E)-4-hydroxy-3-methylbut-2-enyl-diphosphate synthase [Clostridium pasteurianum]AJA48112.1 4-hydroxy-3-methylbut-2-en-1-yl diphosphate synthase [Clostridium pasteurianum DSM 525 = ATCC 6013]AJA52100.1 4-hydroxy-3-methylbut-2-en-1-yl diphosphate synthase [Clostridium pasteurianum DSM 525 = ATCC 6013]AOZ75379.1 4-hydroxy-3-methylbut-2-en-1-yl diphosphate synthase [Clostridium pasteurianum DSM 525 = ATCC 6013]AOZ79174.1 4-hydroxy-3-methylbut-2-en-1-yl diphosphate synthase [